MIRATRPVHLVDTTLRDGLQTPGVSFSPAERLAVATALARLGVGEIEVGLPAMGPAEQDEIRAIVAAGLGVRLTGWCRATPGDLDAAAACGLRGVHVSLPVSDVQLHALGRDGPWALRQLQTIAAAARARFDFVSVGAQDASRAPPQRLIEFVAAARAAGADRVRLADTVGIWTPGQTARTVAALLPAAGPMALGFHGHNDLGMATANTLAALEAGAACADVTVNGLGERAGNAPLEEVAMACLVAAGLDCGIDTTGLADLCRLVAMLSGRPIPPSKPITGEAAFVHESGIHVRSLLVDRRTYEPFDPAAAGRGPSRFAVGTHSGTAGVRHAMAQAGVALDDAAARDLLARARAQARAVRASLEPAELLALYEQSKTRPGG